jgi:hypothetical protein
MKTKILMAVLIVLLSSCSIPSDVFDDYVTKDNSNTDSTDVPTIIDDDDTTIVEEPPTGPFYTLKISKQPLSTEGYKFWAWSDRFGFEVYSNLDVLEPIEFEYTFVDFPSVYDIITVDSEGYPENLRGMGIDKDSWFAAQNCSENHPNITFVYRNLNFNFQIIKTET